jgi:hypothetical protein
MGQWLPGKRPVVAWKAQGHFLGRGNHSNRVSATPMQLCRCDGAKRDRRQEDPDVRFDPEVAMVIKSVA